jgi:hypothetical protein
LLLKSAYFEPALLVPPPALPLRSVRSTVPGPLCAGSLVTCDPDALPLPFVLLPVLERCWLSQRAFAEPVIESQSAAPMEEPPVAPDVVLCVLVPADPPVAVPLLAAGDDCVRAESWPLAPLLPPA